MQTVTCGKCQKHYKVDDRLAGKTVKCKACGHGIVIPALEPVASSELDLAPAEPAHGAPASTKAKTPPPLPAKSARGKAASANACPECSAALAPEAKICISCGYNLVTGKKLGTTKEAAPMTRGIASRPGSGRYARVGNRLSASDQCVLPERCVICNTDDGVEMITKVFTYVPFWAILLLGFLLGKLFQRTSTITYGMCTKHRKLRTMLNLTCAALLLAGVAAIVLGSAVLSKDLLPLCLLSGFGAIFVAVAVGISTPGLRAASIDSGSTGIYRGCGKQFLSEL